MPTLSRTSIALLSAATLAFSAPAFAGSGHDHDHDHAHEHAHNKEIYKGYFEDEQIQPRTLSDWQGDWQSVYPYLVDGTLDPVMAHKAEHGDKTAAEYRAYYETGYATDVDAIRFDGDTVTFTAGGESYSGTYVSDGYEVLTYKKGNRGVRYIFKKDSGDDKAPTYIQFSDHHIAPKAVSHYHLYWGEDRAEVLEELTNWPTYYPASYSADDIVHEMIAH
ncbi:metal-binding protein ZinT [Epibacterium sp. Ofav1-8]|uniref:metal-binding protein ZinT n=1 Tax=Epibacterium sp. Ofav1-8 TaxID=2917735 RepID=UPI001EF62BA5|nr:metal-binding protein ZinT [Epibacterium sp. Ofav1-8]MCG7622129.1 metal-binding protein ZinT [Epibacterium sp. Ofav1-8]